jgi:elongation factor 1-beta
MAPPSVPTVDALNTHLATRSYVTGYAQSADDVAAFKALKNMPAQKSHPHAYRWALHIAALTGAMLSSSGASSGAAAAATDDFDDMFGDAAPAKKADDDIFNYGEGEEGDAEEQAAAKARRERMALAKKLKEEADAKAGKTKKAEKDAMRELKKDTVQLQVQRDRELEQRKSVFLKSVIRGGNVKDDV